MKPAVCCGRHYAPCKQLPQQLSAALDSVSTVSAASMACCSNRSPSLTILFTFSGRIFLKFHKRCKSLKAPHGGLNIKNTMFKQQRSDSDTLHMAALVKSQPVQISNDRFPLRPAARATGSSLGVL